MTSIFEEIKSFFSGPSIEKCSKEEKKENDKHDIKVNEEIERHKSALKKIKETASCKLKNPNTNTIEDTEDTKSIIDTTVMNPLQKVEPPPPPKDEPLDTKDVGLEFPSNQEKAFENQEQPKQFRGGRKRRTRRPRKRSGKNTKRSR